MAVTHTITKGYKTGAGSTSSVSKVFTSNTEINVEDSITALATDFVITVGVDVSQIQCMQIYSDQALTIKTNSTGSPADTIAIPAGKQQIIWTKDDIAACPLTTDVTSFHVANATAVAADFKFSALLDLD